MRATFLWRLLAAALLCAIESLPVQSAPEWVVLDDGMQRDGDRSSLQRHGPWAEFTQRWGGRVPGKAGIIERMAVNCLTGAFSQTQYPSTDSQTQQRVLVTHSFAEVEHAQRDDFRLLLQGNSTELGRALVGLACTCQAPKGSTAPTDTELQSVYDRYIAEPMSKEEFHLSFVRVDSKEVAMAAIAKLKAGASFESVFDEYASPFDAHTFRHGDLGQHVETEWPIDDVRVFRKLKLGEFSLEPHRAMYGWEIYKLQSKRTIPAPTLGAMRPRLNDYVTRAHACGWAL